MTAFGPADPGRLSLNQITINRWTLREAVDGCARQGLRWMGLWRDKVAEAGLASSARLVREAGIGVSSLCRGGFFPAATATERRARLEDNRRAIEEAATLGADVLVLVCGPAAGKDLVLARQQVGEGIAELVPHAAAAGVRLGVEPLHPMFAGDRSVVVTLAQANRLVEPFPADQAGVVIDAYHVWWDPDAKSEILRAGARIAGYHVSDWLVPAPDMLMGRGLMGDGVIQLRELRRAIEAAGYQGPIEVEIFNKKIWESPDPDAMLELIRARYVQTV